MSTDRSSLSLSIFPSLLIIIMAHYKESLKLLFTCWNKAYELSSCIIEEEIRKKALKKLQSGYRRFQREVQLSYDHQQDIDVGLIRYYQVQAEKQYKSALQNNYPLLKNNSFRRVNPWPQRFENFDKNRANRGKIDFSSFISNQQTNSK